MLLRHKSATGTPSSKTVAISRTDKCSLLGKVSGPLRTIVQQSHSFVSEFDGAPYPTYFVEAMWRRMAWLICTERQSS